MGFPKQTRKPHIDAITFLVCFWTFAHFFGSKNTFHFEDFWTGYWFQDAPVLCFHCTETKANPLPKADAMCTQNMMGTFQSVTCTKSRKTFGERAGSDKCPLHLAPTTSTPLLLHPPRPACVSQETTSRCDALQIWQPRTLTAGRRCWFVGSAQLGRLRHSFGPSFIALTRPSSGNSHDRRTLSSWLQFRVAKNAASGCKIWRSFRPPMSKKLYRSVLTNCGFLATLSPSPLLERFAVRPEWRSAIGRIRKVAEKKHKKWTKLRVKWGKSQPIRTSRTCGKTTHLEVPLN